jgi:DNA-binding transcriptional regulator YiaG
MTPDEIRAWRQWLGLTQARAAQELGVGERYMQMLESGNRTPSQTLVNLMRCLERRPR